ncbi:hypothetical protein Q4488_16900 [Amphritea sp. 1_MG-2023]|uniref:hypothetical protein n=1 Tax=Amphritea sp. 1_MG-2023 TaxID=3062670 RepID=UPI0026E4245C|nr:hypothetical protein [Amphritea sp. 1_MG-2023]MDO6565062.1 hypothetical protein [Amphritea sp. 1_MG-2023]
MDMDMDMSGIDGSVIESSLELAEKTNSRISSIQKRLSQDHVFYKQLKNHAEMLEDCRFYLQSKEHPIAFIGAIGIGKTSAICKILDLYTGQKPILSTGSGRTTICEVDIRHGDATSIKVHPHSETEIDLYLYELAGAIAVKAQGLTDEKDTNAYQLNMEIERALRNMTALTKSRPKDPKTGKKTTFDPAIELFNVMGGHAELFKELKARLDYLKRESTHFEPPSDEDPNIWLQSCFESLNLGKIKSAPLPKRIEITTNRQLLHSPTFEAFIKDTKGIDQTSNRQDLDGCLHDERTVSILCSGFNDAPADAIHKLLKSAKESGLDSRLVDESILLILDRNDEALRVTADHEPVEDIEEGREVKRDEIVTSLSRSLSLGALAIQFFNSEDDSPSELQAVIQSKVSALRHQRLHKIEEIDEAVNSIDSQVASLDEEQAISEVRKSLKSWFEENSLPPALSTSGYMELVGTIKSDAHPTSVNASVRRKGCWENLDYYQELGNACRRKASSQFGTRAAKLESLLDMLLKRESLMHVRHTVRQLSNTLDKRLGNILNTAYQLSIELYRAKLKTELNYWDQAAKRWGQGGGYRSRVADDTKAMFSSTLARKIESEVNQELEKLWSDTVIELKELIAYTDAEVDQLPSIKPKEVVSNSKKIEPLSQRGYTCPLCECKLELDDLSQHIKNEHKDQIDSMTTCKVCTTPLKLRNTIKHLKNVHESSTPSSSEKHPKKNKKATNPKVKIRVTTEDTPEETQAKIHDYIKRHPR